MRVEGLGFRVEDVGCRERPRSRRSRTGLAYLSSDAVNTTIRGLLEIVQIEAEKH